jgi:predicted acyl esterase
MRRRLCLAVVAAAAVLIPAGGAQAAGPFDPGPAKYPGMVEQRDQPIVMRDGIRLFADVYRPARRTAVLPPGASRPS